MKPVRDASLVVIASEDEYAVRQYFEFFRSTRIQFKVLPTEGGRGSPEHVLRRLELYREEFEIGEGDVFWLVIDLDHWAEPNHVQNLVQVLRECRQKGIQVALSNPCFDLWLLFHFAEFPAAGELDCEAVADRIRSAVGKYNKTRVDNLPITNEKVIDAVRRAAQHVSADEDIPSRPQTAVYRIVESLLDKQIISARAGVEEDPAGKRNRPGKKPRK